jgi:hypothetical protein
MNDASQPVLDRPGAGLPGVELAVARLLFRWKRMTGDPAGFRQRFLSERERVGRLVTGCPVKRRGERVLIDRVRGLEDSSRFWSVWMTLDHLRIVHGSVVRIVDSLQAGQVPAGAASTAAVKPSPAVGAEVEAAYEASCDRVLAAMERAGEGRSGVRFDHPWFGPLDARGWCALAGTHLRIHRLQMERILEQPPRN